VCLNCSGHARVDTADAVRSAGGEGHAPSTELISK
jgi:hypothetical protein